MAPLKTFAVTEPYIAVSCGLGESPFWEEATNSLRFVDIPNNKVYTVNLDEGSSSLKTLASGDIPVCVTADIEDDNKSFIFFGKHMVGLMDRSSGKYQSLKELWTDDEKANGKARTMRSNDGAVDSRGRFWAGTMCDPLVENPGPKGTFFRLNSDLSLHRIFEGTTIPNGVSWSLDDKTMYWTETGDRTIYAFDFDAERGSISNKRPFYRIPEDEEGAPDGHAMDVEGHLWVAHFGQSRVVRISPSGERVAQITFPTRSISCCRFAGDWLYITSAAEQEPKKYPESVKYQGNLFRCHVGIEGRRLNRFRLSK